MIGIKRLCVSTKYSRRVLLTCPADRGIIHWAFFAFRRLRHHCRFSSGHVNKTSANHWNQAVLHVNKSPTTVKERDAFAGRIRGSRQRIVDTESGRHLPCLPACQCRRHSAPSNHLRMSGEGLRQPAVAVLRTVITRAYTNTPYFPLYTTPPESYVLSVLIRVSPTGSRASGVQ